MKDDSSLWCENPDGCQRSMTVTHKNMSSVDNPSAKLKLKHQNLNNLPSSQVWNIFSGLTVGEISLLCNTFKKFNVICKNESFWRNKIFNDYGIEKKYGTTWRETAQRMFQINMINLNKRWIDGRTYKELLDIAISMDDIADALGLIRTIEIDEFLTDLPSDTSWEFTYIHEEKEIQDCAEENLNRQLTREELDKLEYVNSREMLVIYAAAGIYESGEYLLPGDEFHYEQFDFNNIPVQKEFILRLLDPILYVMQFSSFPISELRKFHI